MKNNKMGTFLLLFHEMSFKLLALQYHESMMMIEVSNLTRTSYI